MIHFLSLFFLLLFFNTACNSLHSIGKNPSVKELFQHASKLKEKSYYKESLIYLKKLKSRFLYSRLAKEADLAIADIYFAQEEWQKAAKAYWNFSELHPQHSEADRALFQLALSYFHQLPTTEDRDLSLSKKTLFSFNRHLKLFPKSPYRSQTQKYKTTVLNLLAQHQWMIARFHLKQNKPHSALPYVLKLMKDYSFLLPKEEKKEDRGKQVSAEEHSVPDSNLPSLKKLKELIRKLKTQKKNIKNATHNVF